MSDQIDNMLKEMEEFNKKIRAFHRRPFLISL